MSSTKIFQEFPNKRMININGQRPNSLSINKTSHTIKKNPNPNSSQKKQPIIIYAHSPKIIHADAKDFMELVQNLTGHSRRPDDKIEPKKSKGVVAKKEKYVDLDEENKKSSLILSEEKRGDNGDVNFGDYFSVFTPNSSNLFCSPQSSLRSNYDASLFSLSPNMSAISSFLEVMKGLPEY